MRVDGEACTVSDGEPVRYWDFARKLWAAAKGQDSAQQGRVIAIPWWIIDLAGAANEWLYYIFTLGHRTPLFGRYRYSYLREGAWMDISKARLRLGYTPQVGTDQGIRLTAEWFRQQSGSS